MARPNIFTFMVEYIDDERLSRLLKALGDTTRRKLLTQLCQHGATRVTDLAELHAMSLNAISKHIKVLESAGLVKRTTIGRTHLIEAELDQVDQMSCWLASLKSIWETSLDRLETLITTGEDQ